MDNPVKFRWILCIAVSAWVCMVAAYVLQLVRWPEFRFIHTLLVPAVLLGALLPVSWRRLAGSNALMPLMAVWGAVAIPGIYIPGRIATGLGAHCDRAFLAGGLAVFASIMCLWIRDLLKRSVKQRNDTAGKPIEHTTASSAIGA